MTAFTITRLRTVFLSGAVLALAACGGGGGSNSSTGTLKLGVTDAPVDHATDVVVEFSGVELKRKGGAAFSIDFKDPQTGQPVNKQIHLLDYQGAERAMLLDGEQVPAGEYEWMRLKVNAEPNVVDSYIVLETDGGQCELAIPSGALASRIARPLPLARRSPNDSHSAAAVRPPRRRRRLAGA